MGPMLLDQSFNLRMFPPLFYELCITVILKPEEDPSRCASYRPVSLLNVGAKMLTATLFSRLQKTMPSVIQLS